MSKSILAEYQAQPWIMEPNALKAFGERIAAMPENSGILAVRIQRKPRELKVVDGIAKIPIAGYLLDKVPDWMRLWGISATGYDEITEQIREAESRDDVTVIELDVDSPGGMVAGVISAADAIYSAREKKPVTAIVNNLSASGAYWLTSQAEKITAADVNTLAGSIGVYTWYVDWTGAEEKLGIKIIVVRSGEHKGMGLDTITENQIAAVQEYIDDTAANFISAVARGRGADSEKIAELATGQLWIAFKAEKLGLIDNVNKMVSPQAGLGGPESQSQSDIGESIMEKEKETDQVSAEQIEKAKTEGASDALDKERQRISAINEKFGDDLEFANKAIAEGWTLEKAHEAFNDVLREKLKTQNTEQKAAGSSPIETGDTDGDGGGDFMAEARELAEQKKISVSAAMKKLARQKPQLHQAFLGKCGTDGKAMYAEAS